jgi:hypothetical protein
LITTKAENLDHVRQERREEKEIRREVVLAVNPRREIRRKERVMYADPSRKLT